MYFSEGEKTLESFVNYIVCVIFANIFWRNLFYLTTKNNKYEDF